MDKGVLYRIAGPVVVAKGIKPRMYDVCRVGKEQLMGEVIQIKGDKTIIQVYEDTSGIRPGEPVINTREPLKVELGPGLLGNIYDGIQRPLQVLIKQMGDFITRGVDAPGLDLQKKWEFKAALKAGDFVEGGTILGEVEENPGIIHKVLVPPLQKGKLKELNSGSFTLNDTIGKLDGGFELRRHQLIGINMENPVAGRMIDPAVPLQKMVIVGRMREDLGGVALCDLNGPIRTEIVNNHNFIRPPCHTIKTGGQTRFFVLRHQDDREGGSSACHGSAFALTAVGRCLRHTAMRSIASSVYTGRKIWSSVEREVKKRFTGLRDADPQRSRPHFLSRRLTR